MGCGGSVTKNDPVGEILQKLEDSYKLIQKQCDKTSLESEKTKVIEERHAELEKVKDKPDEMMKVVKEYNAKELEMDNKLIANENERMKLLYKLGLDLAAELKEKMVKELEEKISKAPSMTVQVLKKKLSEMTDLSPQKFLESDFGKPLREALAKKGLSKAAVEGYKGSLKVQRKDRRFKERGEFNINVNEFPDEEVFDDDKEGETFFDKLMKGIMEE